MRHVVPPRPLRHTFLPRAFCVLITIISALGVISCSATSQPGEELHPGSIIARHLNPISSLAFSPDGQTIASGSQNAPDTKVNTVLLWTPITSTVPITPGNVHDFIASVAFSSDSRFLAAGGVGPSIYIWDRANPSSTAQVIPAPSERNIVRFQPGTHRLISGDFQGNLTVWDLDEQPTNISRTGTVLTNSHNLSIVTSLAVSSDGKTLVASGEYEIRLWRLDIDGFPSEALSYTNHQLSASSVAISSDGTIVAAGGLDGSVTVWQAGTKGTPMEVSLNVGLISDLTGPNVMNTVAMSSDGTHLAAGGLSKNILMWDLSSPNPEPKVLSGHLSAISALAYSPDNKLLASASNSDGTIRIWSVDQGAAK